MCGKIFHTSYGRTWMPNTKLSFIVNIDVDIDMNVRRIFPCLQQPLVDTKLVWIYVKRESNVFGIIINARRPTFMLPECEPNTLMYIWITNRWPNSNASIISFWFHSGRDEGKYCTQYSTVLDRLKCGVLFLLNSESKLYIYMYRDSAHRCPFHIAWCSGIYKFFHFNGTFRIH